MIIIHPPKDKKSHTINWQNGKIQSHIPKFYHLYNGNCIKFIKTLNLINKIEELPISDYTYTNPLIKNIFYSKKIEIDDNPETNFKRKKELVVAVENRFVNLKFAIDIIYKNSFNFRNSIPSKNVFTQKIVTAQKPNSINLKEIIFDLDEYKSLYDVLTTDDFEIKVNDMVKVFNHHVYRYVYEILDKPNEKGQMVFRLNRQEDRCVLDAKKEGKLPGDFVPMSSVIGKCKTTGIIYTY